MSPSADQASRHDVAPSMTDDLVDGDAMRAAAIDLRGETPLVVPEPAVRPIDAGFASELRELLLAPVNPVISLERPAPVSDTASSGPITLVLPTVPVSAAPTPVPPSIDLRVAPEGPEDGVTPRKIVLSAPETAAPVTFVAANHIVGDDRRRWFGIAALTALVVVAGAFLWSWLTGESDAADRPVTLVVTTAASVDSTTVSTVSTTASSSSLTSATVASTTATTATTVVSTDATTVAPAAAPQTTVRRPVTTARPTTGAPTTEVGSTTELTLPDETFAPPTWQPATTVAPSTTAPAPSQSSTTASPTTASPTTASPTTTTATTSASTATTAANLSSTTTRQTTTTAAPTTAAPTTAAPTTAAPTTAAPTTAAPGNSGGAPGQDK